ncbi:MAG: hypothetical protein ACR2OR_11035 [Hyphomicrobiales bacterium]
MKKLFAAIAVISLFAGSSVSTMAQGLADVDNKADVNHPDIHDKVGDGTNANPNGANANGGGIHGIGNVPGQNDGNSPSNGAPGFADQIGTVHGGITAGQAGGNGEGGGQGQGRR